jgi:hypothetical protein
MTELKRWLDDSPPSSVARLLESARREQAPPRVVKRTLVALGATVTLTTTAAGAAGTAGVATPLNATLLGIVAKWGGAGLIGGTLLAGGLAGIERLSAPRPETTVAPAAPPAAAAMNPLPELPRPSTPAVAPKAEPSPVATSASTRTSADLPAPAARSSSTTREIDLLDAARAHLRGGDGAAALRVLAAYERDFASPHFEPEVLFLRMQASVVAGDRAEAKRFAERIVSRYPQSPGVGQAEALLRADEKPGDE